MSHSVASPTRPLCPRSTSADSMRLLFARMQAGDREAAGDFMRRYGDLIQRRVRGKMNLSMRRLFDSQEILSSIGRRLDRFVHHGTVSARDETEFWGFVFELARRAVVDKARLFDRLQRIESEDSEFAFLLRQQFEQRLHSDHEFNMLIADAMDKVRDPLDRQILHFWMQGETHVQTADLLDLTADGVRKRWERIRSILKTALIDSGEFPADQLH